MSVNKSKHTESQKREKQGITYYDCGCKKDNQGNNYRRLAIRTHLVSVGEDAKSLMQDYVLPLAEPSDTLCFSSKSLSLCHGDVRYMKDVEVGCWASILSHFASTRKAGYGVHMPEKMQLVIEICGLPRVILASLLSMITKLFGIHGVFYKVCGHRVNAIDGFYPPSAFELYRTTAILVPENVEELCEELQNETGIPIVIMDANDFDRNILAKSEKVILTDQELQAVMEDNPAGQNLEMTPFILIKKVSVN